ncbi:aminopeptidase N [Gammaproteobacteria bacterium]|nr:aminopeptidase N [Gammaproteobacteria bacterium]
MGKMQTKTTYLKDYEPPEFVIEKTDLSFDLYEDHALVSSTLLFKKNTDTKAGASNTLVLHGSDLSLEDIRLDGVVLNSEQYQVDSESLAIPDLSKTLGKDTNTFLLECVTRIEPQKNTALEGLYKSKKMFCTQCEAEGFRRITYYLDRPDVMSSFTTTISADKAQYPVLLSNGNKVDEGVAKENPKRHWVSWEDPFKKPSYLFALVAGDLVSLDDSFTTCSGRKIKLQIFVEAKDIDKCDHAMQSLKNSMRWDEEVYGREYDLDIFMIVAVDDFNMGAMENKGLNIFNTSCVLANPKTTTDSSFQRVEAVVAHEYFHNWSGNRVTCRDWFQLSLKEGFTVFRDSEFSADMGSRSVKRVEDVAFLKTVQFAEDGGPMAHSVRPDSYMEISNFYTVTIYEKGAELVRMLREIIGLECFRKATDLYFERHDGQAVTTEDFVLAMEDASGMDLSQFRRWYSQAGTPAIKAKGAYNEKEKSFTLSLEQSCPRTPGQREKKPFYIPLRVGLLNQDGKEIPIVTDSPMLDQGKPTDKIFPITERKSEIVFREIPSAPVPSLLRNFSAPVKLEYGYTREELYFLMVHDSDNFNRWNASQLLAVDLINELQSTKAIQDSEIYPILGKAFRKVLLDALGGKLIDKAMITHLLSLPTESFLIEHAQAADIDLIHGAREQVANQLSSDLHELFGEIYQSSESQSSYTADAKSIAQRGLKNMALSYLVRNGLDVWIAVCADQFKKANNMTDQMAALRALVFYGGASHRDLKQEMLDSFYSQWRHEPLVIDQWLVTQAIDPSEGALCRVKALIDHKVFDIKNPNKVRSLIGAFCSQNHIHFHNRDGDGYEFLADRVIQLDEINPQIAARLLAPLTRWKSVDEKRQGLMQVQLQRIKASSNLSKDVYEVVEKSTIL